MAKPKPKKPKRISKRKSKAKKFDPSKQLYDPLKSPYETQGDFETAVTNQAQSQHKPLMEDWEQRRSMEMRSHTGRQSDITGMYNSGDAARRAALERTSAALNNLITLNSGVSGATRDAMAAALRGGTEREAAVAGQLGVASDPTQADAYKNTTSAMVDQGNIGLTGEFGSILGGLGRDIGINEIGRQEASRNEGERWRGVLAGLTQEREDITEQLPGFMSAARQELSTQELGRAGQREQQRLGRLQHGLAERQFGETEKMGRSQRSLGRQQQREAERQGRSGRSLGRAQQRETERSNRENESINRSQVENEYARIIADAQANEGTEQGELLKAKAERFKNGTDLITEYMKPTKQEQGKKKTKRTYEARVTHGYDAMISQLQSATGAGPIEVRQMIMAAVNPQTPWGKRWVERARQEIRTEKNSRVYRPKGGKDKRNPNQSPLGPK